MKRADETRKSSSEQLEPIRAELIGWNICTTNRHMGTGNTPVLQLCRILLAHGFGSHRPLHCDRGGILALTVRSIGEGAQLTVEEGSRGIPRFRRLRPSQLTAKWSKSATRKALVPVQLALPDEEDYAEAA